MSTTNGVSFAILCQCQESEIIPHCALDCDPCDPLVDVPAWWLCSEEFGRFVGDLLVGAVPHYEVDQAVPCSPPFVAGGSLSEGPGDPFGWLVGNG